MFKWIVEKIINYIKCMLLSTFRKGTFILRNRNTKQTPL